MNAWRQALRMLRREWRSGELRVLALAVMVAVAAVSAVGFFTERVERALDLQASELLGADLVVVSDRPLPARYRDQARDLGLRFSEQWVFPSMVRAAAGSRLAMVKVVDEHFPLRGSLRIADAPFAPERPAATGPVPGTVWLEPRLMTALGLRLGEWIWLGEARLRVAAVLTAEPGRAGGLFAMAPRLLFNRADLAATDLIQPASRVSYRLLVAGTPGQVAAYRRMLEKTPQRGVSLQGVADARPEIRSALERARQFLGLAAMTAVLLAGVAVALAARRFAQRHLDAVAILRCLGARQGRVMRIYGGQLLMLGAPASLAGVAAGYLAHDALVGLSAPLLGVALPSAGSAVVFAGLASGLVMLLGFALPPLLQLGSVPPLRVLRRELGGLGTPGVLSYALAGTALAGLLVYQAGQWRLGMLMSLALLATVAVLLGLAVAVLCGLARLRASPRQWWRFGLVSLARRRGGSAMQLVAFSLGIGVLLLLGLVRGDLLDDWRDSLPPDAPNRFLVNIQPQQVAALEAFFRARGLDAPEFHPMVRGRLTAINGRPVSELELEGRARRLAEREFNLSWAAELAPDNRIVAGHWWRQDEYGKALLSVEEGIARSLGVGVDDTLAFDVAGEHFEGRIASLREVQWDSLRANFFVLAPPGLLDEFPATYMTAFYLPRARYPVLDELVREFPNVTVLDVAAIMAHVRRIIERVSLAVEYVFLFTLAAGLMLLYAGIQATHDERLRENAILRTLGGRRRQIRRALAAEFVALGLLAGVLGALLANGLAWLLALKVFSMPYQFNLAALFTGAVAGGLGVGLAGLWGSRGVTRQPPLQVLRRL